MCRFDSVKSFLFRIYQAKAFPYIVAALFAVLFFIKVYGVNVLNPTYVDWLLNGDDITQHYIGWCGYRNGDWTFPIGNTDQLMYPYETSVIFTDSIPIFAVFFKLFAPILPKEFQYIGLWGIMSFCLQGIIAAKIISRFTKSNFRIIICSMLFVMSPVMIQRMFGHTALAGHWILLLALDNFFAEYSCFTEQDSAEIKTKNVKLYLRWVLVGALCSSTHIYFVPMCGIILVGSMLFSILAERKPLKVIIMLASYLLTCVFVIWILGGFGTGSNAGMPGLGEYSFNLNGLYNPQEWYWSRYLRPQQLYGNLQHEGFAYMGLGCLFMLACTFFVLINDAQNAKNFVVRQWKMIISVLIILCVALVIAASPVVTNNSEVVFSYSLPDFIEEKLRIFRATGRFSWIIIYLLEICACFAVIRFANARMSIVFVTAALLMQHLDFEYIYFLKNAQFSEKKVHDNQLRNTEFWDAIANDSEIDEIIYTTGFLDMDHGKAYDIARMAFNNNKSINCFYFARPIDNSEALKESLDKLDESDVFIFRLEDNAMCLDYDMYYYFFEELIIGCPKKIGDFETVDFDNK